MPAYKSSEAQLATRTALVEDLENQLRTAGDASTARELNHQLRQMVLVHRQLLRKVCVCACIELQSIALNQLHGWGGGHGTVC